MGDLEVTNSTASKPTVKALFWQAITPVHSGTGQTSASVIDLPIAREKATGYPVLPASSIKGVLRNGEGLDKQTEITEADKLFGYAGKKIKDEQGDVKDRSAAGDLTLTDARVLCLPVRSYAGTFAYLTCPHILTRLDRDREALGLTRLFDLPGQKPAAPAHDPTAGMLPQGLKAAAPSQTAPASQTAQVCPGSALVYGGKVLFEDIDLSAEESTSAQKAAGAIAAAAGLGEGFASRFAIVPDDIFAYFSETATEVSAHVRLKADSKTVESGGLWYEEAVPAETLFASFVISSKAGDFGVLKRPYLQLGGKGSVGKGLLKIAVEGGV